ncbi:hypothetical protein [Thalassolituus hydrocarboniclasticus]|uniref:DUF4234 domain-containing protein n=1 Tax=Thalassolituus hydrocarboniclasticus TaxID=2742796 RepID=A0ABY6ABB1_9GAMM|nr:hypothetical protein [Thalassolituus hydrocarboniclasticus]UXD87205.1 hypothetical protein HUF19_07075 [Thalassolituus hydrocarboniclasticus]
MKNTIYFLLTIFTGGLFLPYWLVSISTEINDLDNSVFPNSTKIRKNLPYYYGGAIVTYVICVILAISGKDSSFLFFIPCFIFGLSLTTLYFWSVFKISDKLKGLGAKLPNSVVMAILSVYFVSPLVIQIKLNGLSASKT